MNLVIRRIDILTARLTSSRRDPCAIGSLIPSMPALSWRSRGVLRSQSCGALARTCSEDFHAQTIADTRQLAGGAELGQKTSGERPGYAWLNPSKQRTDRLNVLLITQRSRVQIPPPQPVTLSVGAKMEQLDLPKGICSIISSAARILKSQAD